MKWLALVCTVTFALASCGGSPTTLRARAQDEALGRHQRMMLVLLAYARGEYGKPGLEASHHGVRRDLMRLNTTEYDLKNLTADDATVRAAWLAYGGVSPVDVAKAKELAARLAAGIGRWRKSWRAGENDMWQAGIFFPPLGLAILQTDINRKSAAEEADDAYWDQHYPGWRDGGGGGDGAGGGDDDGAWRARSGAYQTCQDELDACLREGGIDCGGTAQRCIDGVANGSYGPSPAEREQAEREADRERQRKEDESAKEAQDQRDQDDAERKRRQDEESMKRAERERQEAERQERDRRERDEATRREREARDREEAERRDREQQNRCPVPAGMISCSWDNVTKRCCCWGKGHNPCVF